MPFIWWKTRKMFFAQTRMCLESTLNDKNEPGNVKWTDHLVSVGGILLKKNCLFPYWSEKIFFNFNKVFKKFVLNSANFWIHISLGAIKICK